jgi:hypothetical protein
MKLIKLRRVSAGERPIVINIDKIVAFYEYGSENNSNKLVKIELSNGLSHNVTNGFSEVYEKIKKTNLKENK